MATRKRSTHTTRPTFIQNQVITPDDACYAKAKSKGIPTFTLVAKDRTAPGVIREWAKRAATAGAPALKVGTAMLDAAAFDRWQADHGSKIPD